LKKIHFFVIFLTRLPQLWIQKHKINVFCAFKQQNSRQKHKLMPFCAFEHENIPGGKYNSLNLTELNNQPAAPGRQADPLKH
jgi:hypothetical protein